MKQNGIRASSLGLTFAGCFFGAGYVSGQELWQFFGAFGVYGYIGVALTMLLFGVFGVLFLRLVQVSGKTAIDELIILKDNAFLRRTFGAVSIVFIFGIFVVMCAGVGALGNQLFSLPRAVGSAVFCVFVGFFALYGIRGAVRVFGFLVPVLVFSTLLICIAALVRFGVAPPEKGTSVNSLLGAWWVSAVNYVSYNMISSIGTLAPLGGIVSSRGTVLKGVLSGCLMMLVMAAGILAALDSVYTATSTELPMLDIAFRLHTAVGYLYAVLLLFGMFGTSLASLVAVVVYVTQKHARLKAHRFVLVLVLIVLAFVGSLVGFGELIAVVYPVFGYIGFAVMLTIIANYFYLTKGKRSA